MNLLEETIKQLLDEGLTQAQISKKLNRAKSTINGIVKRLNYNYKSRNTVIHNYFSNINNPTKAYLLGFFIADGNIYYDRNYYRFSISLNNKDVDILKLYKSELNIPNDIEFLKFSYKEPQVKLRWSSKIMANNLINKYNISIRKTYDINFWFPIYLLPSEYYGDFICGFLDGDGSIETNGKGKCTIRISGTNIIFIHLIEDIITDLIPGIKFNYMKIKGKSIDYYLVTFNFNRINKSDKILKLYNFLYRKNRFCLIRKRCKFEEYLKYLGKL